jgi:cysteine desulfurase
MQRIYLDNAATTPLDPQVLDAMLPYLKDHFGNPSSPGHEGRIARMAVEKARKEIAQYLHTSASQLVFTSGGTEANNLAIRGIIRAKKITRVISSPLEHSSVYKTLSDMFWRGQIELILLSVDTEGKPNLVELEELLKEREGPTLVSLMHANNEIGTMININEVGTLCKKYRAFFHSDSVQTMGHFPMDLSEVTVDMLTLSAHKFHGPKGVGMLWMRKDLGLHVVQTGGAQECGLRAGTENVAGIVGLAKAFSLAMENYQKDSVHIKSVRNRLKEGLEKIGGTVIGSSGEDGLYTVLNMGFTDHERSRHLLLELDIAGISVSAGSACNTGKGSKILEHIKADHFVNIRFSFSKLNQPNEIDRLLAIIEYQLHGEKVENETIAI